MISSKIYTALVTVRNLGGGTTREIAAQLGDENDVKLRTQVSAELSRLKINGWVKARLWEGACKLKWFITNEGLQRIKWFESRVEQNWAAYRIMSSKASEVPHTQWVGVPHQSPSPVEVYSMLMRLAAEAGCVTLYEYVHYLRENVNCERYPNRSGSGLQVRDSSEE